MDRAELIERMAAGDEPEFLFFWGHTAAPGHELGRWVLSQWWVEDFEVDGDVYRSAEHFMMAGKARLFGDDEMLARILRADTPADAKRLGRAVRGFDQELWEQERYGIVVRGNIGKFGGRLRPFLMSTGDTVLVEAAPRDVIWGIGLGKENPKALNPNTWRGQNLLGFALMDARAALRGSTVPRRPAQ
ncbi:NADAR family protein [Actinomycetes bacterium KLBMP 9759]